MRSDLSPLGRGGPPSMRIDTFSSYSRVEFQSRKGFKRIVGAHARDETFWQARRHRIVALELPVRVIGREQEHFLRADLVDDILDSGRIRRRIERLHGDAKVLADDGGRLAL